MAWLSTLLGLIALSFLAYIGYHRQYYAMKSRHWNYAYYPAMKPIHAARQWLYFRWFGAFSLRIVEQTQRTEMVSNDALNAEYDAFRASDSECNVIRIVVISDSHELHSQLRLPRGDVLIHCGDILFANVHRFDAAQSLRKLRAFNEWLSRQPFRHRVIVAGNHDFCCERIGATECRRVLSNATYLENEALRIAIRGRELKLFASPHSIPNSDFSTNRAFQLRRDEIGAKWAQIPSDVDVLVTHCMPFGYLCDGKGCAALLREVRDRCVRCRFHLFGHWHGTYGVEFGVDGGKDFANEHRRNVCFVNASSVDGYVCAIHPPVVFDYHCDTS